MTTSPAMTVTDELLAELEELAGKATPQNLDSAEDIIKADAGATIIALTAELRRLRAENAGLAQSLAESRANDQAAMGWVASFRWASGDRGERTFPELATHFEGLAKDAGRYRWLRDHYHGLSHYREIKHRPNALRDEIDAEIAKVKK